MAQNNEKVSDAWETFIINKYRNNELGPIQKSILM